MDLSLTQSELKGFDAPQHLGCMYTRLPTHPASVDRVHFAAHVRAGLAGQIHHRSLEIIRVSPSSCRDTPENTRSAFLVLNEGGVHVGRNIARRDSIDVDSFGRPLVRQRLGQLGYATLGCCVCRYGQSPLEGHERSHVDDAAALTGRVRRTREHVRANVATESKDRGQINLKDLHAF